MEDSLKTSSFEQYNPIFSITPRETLLNKTISEEELYKQIGKLESELVNSKKELFDLQSMNSMNKSYEEHINEVKNLLKEKVPSIENILDVTLKKDRENQEIKNRQVLEVLKFKDSSINELQKKNTESNALISTFQEQISDHQVIINNQENIIVE